MYLIGSDLVDPSEPSSWFVRIKVVVEDAATVRKQIRS